MSQFLVLGTNRQMYDCDERSYQLVYTHILILKFQLFMKIHLNAF